MSNKFPMISLGKVEVKLTMKVEAVVHLDRITQATGLSRAAIINGYVEDALKKAKVRLTSDDLKRIDELKKKNAEKREALKIAKGSR